MSANPALQRDAAAMPDPNLPQRRASDPAHSVCVGASAGAGKTKVLTDRVLRLLLPRGENIPGTPAHRILCLTFTKAGASEMLQRIGRTLARWAVTGDDSLHAALAALTGTPPDTQTMDAARRLFASVIDTPGGLKVMTIHSFCQSVLGRFPLEAGIAPHFTVIDEGPAADLAARARDEMLERARTDPASPLGRAVAALTAALNETQFTALMNALTAERQQLEKAAADPQILRETLTRLFSLPPGATPQSLTRDACRDGAFDAPSLYAACRALAGGTEKSDIPRGLNIQLWLDAPEEKRAERFETHLAQFLTSDGAIRKSIATKKVQEANPACLPALMEEAERLAALRESIKAAECVAATCDLILIGGETAAIARRLREEKALLDYDDLILKTLSLLRRPGIAPWILFKLDGGLDHVLIDEAQDTNPEQWDIVKALCDDFFSGEGAREDTGRTVFTVGDEKQSIYSFQRAAPHEFRRMRLYFMEKAQAREEQMDVSFRSTAPVLRLVDETFAAPETRTGLGDREIRHHSGRAGQAGCAELWPLCAPEGDAGEEELWAPPVRIVEAPSPAARLADHIGRTIRLWIDRGERLESQDRPLRPGDIMILVRTRTAFVGQLVRALKTRNIEVSGIDRMDLGSQIGVMDLLALARFALLPADDLSLACVLKSPLVGYDEDRLYALAAHRPGSLWQALRESGDTLACDWLSALIRAAATDHPYEFFSGILRRPCPADEAGGRRALHARLGEDTLDPLDEFLNAALSYERGAVPTLQGFLLWQQQGAITVKREMEEAGNAVRIMTVHGSKGLQAPVVILPDTVRTTSSRRTATLLWPDRTGLPVPLWCPRSESFPALYRDARARVEAAMDEEYRRLLYVAMTRAEDRLYIGGCRGKKEPLADSWYNYAAAAFSRLPDTVEDETGTKRIAVPQTAAPDQRAGARQSHGEDSQPLPGWLFREAAAEPTPPRPLVPSRPEEAEPAMRSPLDGESERRFRRGNVTHSLLQILPAMPPEKREQAARRYAALPAHSLSPSLQADIVAETLAVLDNPACAPLFSPAAVAEAPVAGLVDGRLVSARIDRLLVTDSEILIVDYKSNRPPPCAEKDVPAAYRSQMKSYRALLAAIYPDRPVRCFLLWTDGPRLMELENL